MANETIVAQLLIARASIETVLAALQVPPVVFPPDPDPTVAVGASDNLLSLIDANPAGTIFAVDPAFVLAPGANVLDFAKPFVVTRATTPGTTRVDNTLAGPIFRGSFRVLAPGVSFIGVRFEGLASQPQQTILTTGPQTLLDRCVVYGSANGQRRGITANSSDVTLSKCYIANIWHQNEPQAVCGWDGTKNLQILDCYLEASGENVLIGGADPVNEANLPRDILIEDCTFDKNTDWRSLTGRTTKNLLELKNVIGFTMRDCVLEHSWRQAQDGYGLVFTVRNQGGTAPYSTIQDVLVEDVTVRHTGAGINILGRDNTRFPAGHPQATQIRPSVRMENVILRRITWEDLDPVTWRNLLDGKNASGRTIQIQGGPKDLVFEDWTVSGSNLHSAFLFDEPQYLTEGLDVTGSRFQEGTWGIFGSGSAEMGTAVLEKYAPGYAFTGNTMVRTGTRLITYPDGTVIE